MMVETRVTAGCETGRYGPLIRTHSTSHVVSRRARIILQANAAWLSHQQNQEITETIESSRLNRVTVHNGTPMR